MSALVDMWTREIDGAMARMRDELSFQIWCPTDYLKALHHIHRAGLNYEGTSRMEGRVHFWDRKRRLGRVADTFDIEAQILNELGRHRPETTT